MIVLLILGVVMTGVAVRAATGAARARRSQIVERVTAYVEHGSRPDSPSELGIDFNPKQSAVASLVTRLGGIFGGRIGSVSEKAIREQLMMAGMYTISPRLVIGYRILTTIMLPLLAALLLGVRTQVDIMIVGLSLFVGWVLPLTLVQRKARLRVTEIDRVLPDLIDLLCVMIEAGLSFPAALRLASDQFGPPLSDELRLTLQEQTMGLGIDEALAHMAGRADTPGMKAFVRAMTQGEKMGISLGQVMRSLSHEMRHRRRSMAEEKAQKTPVLMLFPLVFLIFPAMFIVLMTPAVINMMHSLKAF
jgi:tight adherence protein C